MTTIVWDGKKLVTDSRSTQGNLIEPTDDQKIYEPGKDDYWEIFSDRIIAVAMSGTSISWFWIKEILQNGLNHKTDTSAFPSDIDFGVLCVTESGECWHWTSQVHRNERVSELYLCKSHAAEGSGGLIARTMMSVGFDGFAAVEAAIKMDVFSGGAIQSWEFPGKPAVLSTRPVAPESKHEDQAEPSHAE